MSLHTTMFSSKATMGPPPKRRRIDAPASQVDEDIVAENRANGGSDVDSELEFEYDSDLGAVEDIEPEITPGQTMVLGLQSGKSWAESIKKCQDTLEYDYETSDSDDSSYEEAVPNESKESRAYGQYQREKEMQESMKEKLELYKSHAKTLQKMLEKKVLPMDHKVEKTGRKQEWESALQFRRATSLRCIL
ncbi:hypothetical protein V8E54_007742 [Elaphomyces granulatus]